MIYFDIVDLRSMPDILDDEHDGDPFGPSHQVVRHDSVSPDDKIVVCSCYSADDAVSIAEALQIVAAIGGMCCGDKDSERYANAVGLGTLRELLGSCGKTPTPRCLRRF